MSTSASDTPISVHGGYGGTHAVTDDLETASRLVEEAGEAVVACWRQLSEAQRQLEDQVPLATPTAQIWVVRAREVVEEAMSASSPMAWLMGALHACTRDLLLVAHSYAEAEENARAGISMLDATGRYLHDVFATGVAVTRAVGATVWRWSNPGQIAHNWRVDPIGGALMPNRLPPMTGYLNRGSVTFATGLLDEGGTLGTGHGPSRYQTIATALAGLGAGLEWVMREPTITGVTARPSPVDVPSPRDLAGALGNLDTSTDHLATVETITAPDGTVSYIVNIPGTDDNGFSNINPRDWPANLQGATGDANGDPVLTDYARAIAMVMEEAGIPPDAPVMLVGHSQGATVAYGLAASPELQERYSITHVLTAGSPADDQPRKADVNYLSIQDASDIVPGTDGDRGTRGANEVLVTTDARASSDPETAAAAMGIVSAHSIPQYERLARDIDAKGDPSVEHFKDSASPFFGGGTVERTVYQAPSASSSVGPSAGSQAEDPPLAPRGRQEMPTVSEATRQRALEYFNQHRFLAPPTIGGESGLSTTLGTVAPLPGGRD